MFPSSELVLTSKNEVYHLGIKPDNLAEKVIIVGDQDRVGLVSEFFDSLEYQSQHREFVCHTGSFQGKRITALSTGIGTDNIDIVINELDALVNIDLENRIEKPQKQSLEIVRIGTCGILQPDIPVHSYILSKYALGFDNVAHFYEILFSDDEKEFNSRINDHLLLPNAIQTYFASADKNLFDRMNSEVTKCGITITSSGFYGPQGRSLRIPTHMRDIHLKLGSFEFQNEKILNFEMESSALFALGKQLGHQCATICLGVANRPNLEFSKGYQDEMKGLIKYVLDRI
ncbi:MAG: nucleoside phosphorylase [Bacteroidetes bacterium]|nr:nucleoside phosphorylase [Bacteroidota bacterium]